MSNISILEQEKCTGCGACYNACPFNAIDMVPNSEGYEYPTVNDNCINCGKCACICPQLNNKSTINEEIKSYAVIGKKSNREKGSSGGVFGTIANDYIEEGVVYGAGFSNNCRELSLLRIDKKENLCKIFKSKYIQASTKNIFKEVKKDLESNKKVVFAGCPCQVDGLKAYLGKEYSNLLLIDILCHGVPSMLAYNRYLDEISNGREVVNVDFRDKKYGWGTLLSVQFNDGTVHYDYYNGSYFKAFLGGLNMRKSCYICKYANPNRVGDITLGDFWGIDNINKSLNDGKGTSLVICNTKKGLQEIEKLKKQFDKITEIPYDHVVNTCKSANGALVRPTYSNSMRKCFFKHIAQGDSFSKSFSYSQKSLMDVGIVGWWIETDRSNYGSTLTCYALYQFISSLGLSTCFISPPGFDRKYAGNFNLECEYRMTAKYSYDDMKENNKYIDTFVVGSDVLWYYNAMISSGYTFLLDFVNDSKKKISYSTSFGNTKSFFPDTEVKKAKKYLKKFDYVAVRENEGVQICKDVFGVAATQVLDPVFICDMQDWNKLESKSSFKKTNKYIFVYMLDPNKEKAKKLKEISKILGLDIISITDKQFNKDEKVKELNSCGIMPNANVFDFISIIKNADYVITDSYHGFCFSLVFRKPFAVILNSARGVSRFETVQKNLKINKGLYFEDEFLKTDTLSMFYDQYNDIEKSIISETNRSRKWLIDSLKGEKKKERNVDLETLFEEIENLKGRIEAIEREISENKQQ